MTSEMWRLGGDVWGIVAVLKMTGPDAKCATFVEEESTGSDVVNAFTVVVVVVVVEVEVGCLLPGTRNFIFILFI